MAVEICLWGETRTILFELHSQDSIFACLSVINIHLFLSFIIDRQFFIYFRPACIALPFFFVFVRRNFRKRLFEIGIACIFRWHQLFYFFMKYYFTCKYVIMPKIFWQKTCTFKPTFQLYEYHCRTLVSKMAQLKTRLILYYL